MTYLPPDPEAWQTGGKLRLQQAADKSWFGEYALGYGPIYVRNWIGGADGVITFDYQFAEDEQFRAMVEDMGRRTGSG